VYILWRYIIKEHISPFAFGLGILTLVFLLNIVFRELGRILSRGLPAGVIFEFFYLNLAWIVALAVPMAVLIATLMAFGRLSGDGEITAMKAGGVSILHIIFPIIILSILLAIAMVWFNNAVLPEANLRFKMLNSDIAQKRPTLAIEPGVMFRDIDDFSMLVETIEETTDTSYVTKVLIEDNSNPQKSTYIRAQRGKIFLDKPRGMMFIRLYDGELHELDLNDMQQYHVVEFTQQQISKSVPEMVLNRSEQGVRGDREKSAKMMLAEIQDRSASIENRRERMSRQIRNYFEKYLQENVLETDKEILTPSPFRNVKFTRSNLWMDNSRLRNSLELETDRINSLKKKNAKLMVEVHKKYSIPVACIVFVLVGAPLGVMSRRGNMGVAGSIAFIFFLIYWSCLIGGEELADNRIISPFVAMWTANLICGIAGVYLIIHSVREAQFINWDAIQLFFKKLGKKK